MLKAAKRRLNPYQITQGTLPSIVTAGEGDNVRTDISLGDLTIDAETMVKDFAKAVVNSNTTIPIVVLDGQNEILDSRNIKPSLGADSLTFIREQAREMRQSGHAMQMNLSQAGGGGVCKTKQYAF